MVLGRIMARRGLSQADAWATAIVISLILFGGFIVLVRSVPLSHERAYHYLNSRDSDISTEPYQINSNPRIHEEGQTTYRVDDPVYQVNEPDSP